MDQVSKLPSGTPEKAAKVNYLFGMLQTPTGDVYMSSHGNFKKTVVAKYIELRCNSLFDANKFAPIGKLLHEVCKKHV